MTDTKKNVYWDTCAWLGLINQEPGKVDRCKYIVALARAGDIQIWTSTFTMAEVFKKTCDGNPSGLSADDDSNFENYIEQSFLTLVQVDYDIGVQARRLLRAHSKLKKPADAIHLATAVLYNVDEMHTFDQKNLLPLSGQVVRQDGVALSICLPQEDPIGSLFAGTPLNQPHS